MGHLGPQLRHQRRHRKLYLVLRQVCRFQVDGDVLGLGHWLMAGDAHPGQLPPAEVEGVALSEGVQVMLAQEQSTLNDSQLPHWILLEAAKKTKMKYEENLNLKR